MRLISQNFDIDIEYDKDTLVAYDTEHNNIVAYRDSWSPMVAHYDDDGEAESALRGMIEAYNKNHSYYRFPKAHIIDQDAE